MLKRLQTLWQTVKSLSAKVMPSSKWGHALLVAGGMVALSLIAFFVGQQTGLARVEGQQPNQNGMPVIDGTSPDVPSIVAYINGNTPVTREELGMYLIERFGRPADAGGGVTVDVNLTREEIGQLVSARVETVIRILSRWQKAGWITSRPGGMEIARVDMLERILETGKGPG